MKNTKLTMMIPLVCLLAGLAGCSESGTGKGGAGAQSVKAAETNGSQAATGSQR